MSLMIAGERSGVGKTTVTLALLAYLCRHSQVQSFKVGPDYIDPMFHRHVTGRPCRNLDPMLTSESYVQHCFSAHAQTADCALVEGVMGLFDGAAGQTDFASTAHVARLLKLPVLLVLDCSGLSHSIAALVHGYRTFDPRLQFAGVVLNRVGSDRHLDLLQSALEPLNIPILGVMRRHDEIQLPDRHLGLVPTAELENLNTIIDQLAHLAESWFDWEQLMPWLQSEGNSPRRVVSSRTLDSSSATPPASPRIAIAQDAAFSFYYADNLNMLAELGAELVPWSPLQDLKLPEGVQGLYFGGGFPEMFGERLAANDRARTAVYQAIRAGMPTYAECGGLMYLCQQITDLQAQSWNMVGILPAAAVMGRLTLGYRQVTALQDGVMFQKGAIAAGHEFHRSHPTVESSDPLFETNSSKPNDKRQKGRLASTQSARILYSSSLGRST